MAFAFAPGERVDREARRLSREGASLLLRGLDAGAGERAVHDARRASKRVRALVRLIAGAIGDEASVANAALRDAAQALSSARDAAVTARTFARLAGKEPSAARVAAKLERHRTSVADAFDVRVVEAHVRAFKASIERWSFEERGWDALRSGAHDTYRAGRRALAKARAEAGHEALHELRKRGKDLQYQLALLREAWPEVLDGYHAALSTLGDRLGEDHDLWVLRRTLQRRRGKDVHAWLTRIDARRDELRAAALPLAEKIWFDRPRAWTDRLEAYWARAR